MSAFRESMVERIQNLTRGISSPSVFHLDGMNHVLQKKRSQWVCKNIEERRVTLTQCQKTMSPGTTFGTEVIVSSSLRCG